MSNKNSSSPIPDALFAAPFVMGKMGFDMALTTAVSLARVAQIAMQSADTALAKYIELTEQEIKRSQRKESVKVE
jgi:hypothetical protein